MKNITCLENTWMTVFEPTNASIFFQSRSKLQKSGDHQSRLYIPFWMLRHLQLPAMPNQHLSQHFVCLEKLRPPKPTTKRYKSNKALSFKCLWNELTRQSWKLLKEVRTAKTAKPKDHGTRKEKGHEKQQCYPQHPKLESNQQGQNQDV